MRTLLVILSLIISLVTGVGGGAPVGQDSKTEESQVAAGKPLESVDLRPAFQKMSFGPRQQGTRATCSVFTIAGAVEFAAAKRQGHCPQLSVEFLNWAANQACGDKEDGGFFSDLWKGFAAYGICSEDDMPYQSKFEAEALPSAGALADARTRLALGLRLHWLKEWNVQTGLTDAEFDGVRRTLTLGWPVCGGFRWPKQERWIHDVLQMCPSNAVRDGHSVLLVGYRDETDQPGGGTFIFRNSGGAGGDGFMPYEYARLYMNDAVWVDYPLRTNSPSRGDSSWLGDPLANLASLPAGRNRRISSNELPAWHDANLDMTILPPGKTVEMPVLEGPGVITHIWFTSHAGRVDELNSLTLRIYWDGREHPGVEVPLGEFFAVGQGKPETVESVPVQVSPSGALTCYWRMPFTRSARLVVSNDNPDRTTGLYWQVDWIELQALPPNTPYFHANYRQEYPARAGQDYLIADLEGRGQYIGTVMSVTLAQDGWWGEGDDFFYIDGESVPSLQGTGSEDYFNDAWGFRPRTSHWFGQPRWQGDNAGDSGVCYRWHVLDPVGFDKSLKVMIEHKGNRAEDIEGFYLERPDFLNSIAFWYQLGEPKAFADIPPYLDRRVPWQNNNFVRAFRQARSTGVAKVRVDTAGMFGARPVLSWTNTELGARLTLPFSVEAAGRYAARLSAPGAPEYGAYRVEIDKKPLPHSIDFRASEDQELDLALGTYELKPGAHEITFEALAAENRMAKAMAVEMLRLLRLPPEAKRMVKTHHEAHFIRLGIGRAVYAYRLAYGELPRSLKELVEAGLLPSRYLADENEKPLHSHREGDYLVVESVGPEPWTYRWQGLDARR